LQHLFDFPQINDDEAQPSRNQRGTAEVAE
jgi:hypothetical protein